MEKSILALVTMISALTFGGVVAAAGTVGLEHVTDDVIGEQRRNLAAHTDGAAVGPQSPRDIDSIAGSHPHEFEQAPAYTSMNLCNIHFHENAEHRGGEFTTFAGNGDGHGNGTGYKYDGALTEAELAQYDHKVGESDHGDLVPGDTIEVHYVHSSDEIEPGPTLGSCLADMNEHPFLRVETQVYVLVNDETAADFVELNRQGIVDGLHQAINIPTGAGAPVEYAGSTTGPGYNEKGSPFQVTWSVRHNVVKVSIQSIEAWLEYNVFEEEHAHGVRNLVVNPDLLSPIN